MMKYEETLITLTDKLCESNTMYSLILLDAKSLTLTLSGYRCFLDGKYIVCLNIEDTVSIQGGYYKAVNLSFAPYFYNINLNHDIIGRIFYDEMREKYGYPDFRLFRMRDNGYFGIISVSDEEYNTASLYFDKAKRDIATHTNDVMWSCRARSDIISILHIAEGAYMGKQSGLENEIVRYIHDNITSEITLESLCSRFNTNRTTVSKLIKEKTGLPPMKYLLETRLIQSRPDLLFTKLPINEIAEKYGFSDVNYYIRAFKKRFGKAPLQFRKDGWEERLRDEGIYQRRAETEKTDMTVKEFCDYYKKGLGRAITLLKKQADKTPYKEAFAEMILSEKEAKGHARCLDIYEKDIIDVFDDDGFKEKIVKTFLDRLDSELGYHTAIPLLILLGYRDKAEEIVERRYKESYAQLLEYTQKAWDGEKYPPFAKTYMQMASTLGRFLKAGDERIKQILFDIADLFDYSEYPVIPTYQNPLFSIWDGIGRDHFPLILDEAVKEHKNGKFIDIRQQILYQSNIKYPPVTIEEILKHNNINGENFYLVEGFKDSRQEVIKAVAKAALEETDMTKKLYLLEYFTNQMAHDIPPVEFPLDIEPLIKLMEEENFDGEGRTPCLTYAVWTICTHKRCKAAHDLGVRMYFNNQSDGLRVHSIPIRFGKNYIPEIDKGDFVALLRAENTKEQYMAIQVFIDDLKYGIDDLPLDLIPYIFANIHPGYAFLRKELCQVLIKKELMPEELKLECLYDADKNIRELFLKTQKPKKTPLNLFLTPPKYPDDK